MGMGRRRERERRRHAREKLSCVFLRLSLSLFRFSLCSLLSVLSRSKRKKKEKLPTSAGEPVGELDVVLEDKVLVVGVGERHGRVEDAREAVVLGGVRGLVEEEEVEEVLSFFLVLSFFEFCSLFSPSVALSSRLSLSLGFSFLWRRNFDALSFVGRNEQTCSSLRRGKRRIQEAQREGQRGGGGLTTMPSTRLTFEKTKRSRCFSLFIPPLTRARCFLPSFKPFRSLPAYQFCKESITAVDPAKKQVKQVDLLSFPHASKGQIRIESSRSFRIDGLFYAPFRFSLSLSLLSAFPSPLSPARRRPCRRTEAARVLGVRGVGPAGLPAGVERVLQERRGRRGGRGERDERDGERAGHLLGVVLCGFAFGKSLSCEGERERERDASVSSPSLFVERERRRKRWGKWKEKRNEGVVFRKAKKKKNEKKKSKKKNLASLLSLSPSLFFLFFFLLMEFRIHDKNDVDRVFTKEFSLKKKKTKEKKETSAGWELKFREKTKKEKSLFSLSALFFHLSPSSLPLFLLPSLLPSS